MCANINSLRLIGSALRTEFVNKKKPYGYAIDVCKQTYVPIFQKIDYKYA